MNIFRKKNKCLKEKPNKYKQKGINADKKEYLVITRLLDPVRFD
jgi:hypothetical protein